MAGWPCRTVNGRKRPPHVARRLPWYDVPCPTCGAWPGDFCHGRPNGRDRCHDERMRASSEKIYREEDMAAESGYPANVIEIRTARLYRPALN